MAPVAPYRYHLPNTKKEVQMSEHVWQWIGGALLLILAAINPHAAAGAAFGCCFFMAYPSASKGLQRLLYAAFSWGLGYAAGVFFYGDGPPYSQRAMLVSAAVSALAVLIFIAWGSIIRRQGNLPPWMQTILDIVFPFRAKRGEDDAS
jgi:hypothetical protein